MRSSLASTSAIFRQLLAGFELGDLCRAGGFDVEQIADFVLDVGEAPPGAVAAFLGARRFGAGFADGFQRGPRRLVGLGELGLGFRQAVGGGAARRGRRFDLADQRRTLAGEFLRRVFEFGALGLGFFGALADGDDLRRGVVLALVPFRAFGGDRLQPAIGKFGIARNRLRFDPHFGERCAVAWRCRH